MNFFKMKNFKLLLKFILIFYSIFTFFIYIDVVKYTKILLINK